MDCDLEVRSCSVYSRVVIVYSISNVLGMNCLAEAFLCTSELGVRALDAVVL